MILTVRLTLKPTKAQVVKLYQLASAARFCFNESLAFWNNYYRENGVSPKEADLRAHLRDLKYNQRGMEWLQDVPESIQKQSCKDLCIAWVKYFNGLSGKPNFKRKVGSKQSFYQRTDKFRVVDDTHIKITGIDGYVKVGKNNREYLKWFKSVAPLNPRVVFDGRHWFINLGIDIDNSKVSTPGELLTGVDLGERKLATLSSGEMYPGLHNDPRVKKLLKRMKTLQRILSRKYESNKVGGKFTKTNNIRKLENKIRGIHKRIADIRATYLHTITMGIVSNSEVVCMENLNIKGLMRNKYRAKIIALQGWHELRRQVEYKCQFYNVGFKIADKYYPSSKKCSCCGEINYRLGSSEVFVCNSCGLVIDRDINAARNLSNLLAS